MNNVVLAGFLKKQIQKYEGGADLEANKDVSISTNGTTVVQPTSGKDGMEQVTVTVNCPAPKTEQSKTVSVTENGTTTVTPDSGKALSSVTINTNVAGGGGGATLYCWEYETETDGESGLSGCAYIDISSSPSSLSELYQVKSLTGDVTESLAVFPLCDELLGWENFTKISNSSFSVVSIQKGGSVKYTYTRASDSDVSLW